MPSSPRLPIFFHRAVAVPRSHGHLDRGALFRRQGFGRRRDRLARSGFRKSAFVLSVQSSVLLRPARSGPGHRGDRGASLLAGWRAAGRFARNVPDWSRVQEINFTELALGRQRSIRTSCAAWAPCSCWRWRCDSSWAATACCSMSMAVSWWASITSTRTSRCRCNGCLIASCVVSAVALLAGKWRLALLVVAAFLVRTVIPPIVTATYVRPNEISHRAARSSSGTSRPRARLSESTSAPTRSSFHANPNERIDLAKHKPLLDNVRLWDWHAFHDTSAVQPYRPYIYSDTDVDRYTIDGQMRQVMISPRELDLTQLGDARHLDQSAFHLHARLRDRHGRSQSGFAQRTARADRSRMRHRKSRLPGLKLTRPELYYGENVHDPVFVRTAQPEFNYPAGEHNVENRYDGNGGFPISSLLLRLAAAVSERRLEHSAYQLPHAGEPHDDSPQCDGSAWTRWRISWRGMQTRIWCLTDGWPPGLDCRWLYDVACASLLARNWILKASELSTTSAIP